MKKTGFTTTIPVDIVISSNRTPVDLNNLFITDADPTRFIDIAHNDGIPRNTCSWIKGLYGVVKECNIDEIIAVYNGDCSNTHALAELFLEMKIPVITFSYPTGEEDRYQVMKRNIDEFAKKLEVGTLQKASKTIKRIDKIRDKLRRLDELTTTGHISGEENHIWLVTSTDFNSDLEEFERKLDDLLHDATHREPESDLVRIGVIGVPPIITDLYGFVESKGGHVVYNEVQRQFSIPSKSEDYYQRYIDYTYPYDVFKRIDDIAANVQARKIDGLIHYVQTFCYRHMHNILIKKYIDVPIITIEGDSPTEMDARSALRLESFIEMLGEKRSVKSRI